MEPAYVPGWETDIYRIANGQPNTAPTSDNIRRRYQLATGSVWGSNRFGSAHTTGFHVAMGDGSIQFLSYSINLTTFRDLCVRNDGNTIKNY